MSPNQEDIIIFCQAPSDVPLLLTIYEEYNGVKNIIVYVINVENNYKFINGLNLVLKDLIYIPYSLTSLKNPILLLKERKRIRKLIKRYFLTVSNTEIYFFSRFEDWLTGAFLQCLAKKNRIKYVGNYDDVEGDFDIRKSLDMKRMSLKLIYRFLTNVNFKLEIPERLPEFPFEKYKIEKKPLRTNPIVYEKYGYQLQNQCGKYVAIFLVVPYQSQIFIEENYLKVHIQLIELLKLMGWRVALKGHPRLGIPIELSKLADLKIPEYIPAEFIKNKGCSLCLGVITAGIVYFAKETLIPTYSLANLFEFTTEHLRFQYMEFLRNFSNNKVKFLGDFEDFKKLIKYTGNDGG